MKEFTVIGRFFIAAALIAFGVQHFVSLNFVTRAFPPLPLWMPVIPVLACIFGSLLCVTGFTILFKYKARVFCLILAATIFIMFLVFLLPSLIAQIKNAFLWTNSGKALVLVGACLLAAGSFAKVTSEQHGLLSFLEKIIPLGKYFLSAFLF